VELEARGTVMASARASMTRRRIEEEVRKNWPLIAVLVICDLISIIPAYALSGIQSVAATVFFILLCG
jgi:hypothetical protein